VLFNRVTRFWFNSITVVAVRLYVGVHLQDKRSDEKLNAARFAELLNPGMVDPIEPAVGVCRDALPRASH
jgi:hypothetical protein